MEGQDLPFSSETQKAYYNRLKNDTLHFFSGLGFFTEELVGETDGKPLYRYDLTELGRKYVDWGLGETNFCFGRVVVDKIERIKDTINGVGGGTVRDVYITYHIENIPDWVKNPQVYKRFGYSKKLTTGESVRGRHSYKVLGKNRLETLSKVSRIFQWAFDFKEEIEE
jgi:hypothetical protein